MPRSHLGSTPSVLLALVLGLVGCHQCGHGEEEVGSNSGLVGGDCKKDKECIGKCLGGKNFPKGTCSVACDEDVDCPDFTRCIEVEGGTCLLECEDTDECRDGYGCFDRDRHGHDGDAYVCIHD